jgi:hypothetical protein
MAINTGDNITAADYNTLQSRVEQILGAGSGTFGYGQIVKSSQVSGPTETLSSDATDITAEELNNLRDDIKRIYVHQTGVDVPIGIYQGTGGVENNFQNKSEADVIGADQTAKKVIVDDENNFTYIDVDETKGFNDLVNIVDQIESESNRFTINSTQQDDLVLLTDRRTDSWSYGSIQSEIRLFFENADQRRFFFNAGGQIRITGTITDLGSGESFQRNQKWRDLVQNPGEIQFGYNYTQNTGTTNGVSFPDGIIGNYDLTGSYQTIFRKDASSILYGNSYWKIEAREDTDNIILLKVTLVDDGPESDSDTGAPGGVDGGVKEPVTADVEFDFSARRANGTIVTQFPAVTALNSLA